MATKNSSCPQTTHHTHPLQIYPTPKPTTTTTTPTTLKRYSELLSPIKRSRTARPGSAHSLPIPRASTMLMNLLAIPAVTALAARIHSNTGNTKHPDNRETSWVVAVNQSHPCPTQLISISLSQPLLSSLQANPAPPAIILTHPKSSIPPRIGPPRNYPPTSVAP
ncbi:hypothetical protein PGT21_004083 [Puccinia graminis f. sp. tritici]|uniref:Uncharacterized protein n=1 Tax=Puccinia graminis f. sp. tritici TaxID=56615 RepID=A0A5B0Q1Y1_PUCGR|nr:hypothetical protein PGT21_004083 [Puccinia graminis f. sp. tritici]KAA1137243.1 hypothetical protein PGTUg99_010604 [Puccinia graminis f. sp. tritici]